MLNLDTHIFIGQILGDLTDAEKRKIDSADSFCISDIVLWELCKLVEKGRLKIDLDSPEIAEAIASVSVIPITFEIARQSCALDFQSDPADQVIAATSIIKKAPLLTRDEKILKSKMVSLA